MGIKVKTYEYDVKNDVGSIVGYASTWIREPDSWGDIVAKGAFAESIAKIKAENKTIPLLWGHQSENLRGKASDRGCAVCPLDGQGDCCLPCVSLRGDGRQPGKLTGDRLTLRRVRCEVRTVPQP